MPELVVPHAGIQVNGQSILSVLDGFGLFEDKAKSILVKHGLEGLTPNGWYPLETYFAAFREIASAFGPNILYQIGRSVPRNAVFPPEINTIEKALSSIDVAFQMNHRGAQQLGHYKPEMVSHGHAKMVCDTPYPCHFDRGIITELAQRFAPGATVQHDDSAPCRRKGDRSCTYHVRWA